MASDSKPNPLKTHQSGVAEKIIQYAERDVVFSIKILGESRQFLQQHFQDFIRTELNKHDVTFDDHPLLLPFIETHGSELTEFVTAGVALEHQISLQRFEELAGDPMKLFRVDLWDSLSSHIQNAEQHFVSGIGGLQQILSAVSNEREFQATMKSKTE